MRLTLSQLSKAATATKTKAKAKAKVNRKVKLSREPITKPTLDQYLTSLKATQLKAIARATGIPSTGRKDVLRKRIGEELAISIFLDECHQQQQHHNDGVIEEPTTAGTKETGKGEKSRELSILSIDMGIQNLAFAHLLVNSPFTSQPSPPEVIGHKKENSKGEIEKPGEKEPETEGLVTLNAWHRIGVQELAGIDQHHGTETSRNKNTDSELLRSLLPAAAFRTFTDKAEDSAKKKRVRKKSEDVISSEEEEFSVSSTDTTGTGPATETTNENFSPKSLSQNAYILLSALIKAYRPTHILIERQRFRSAGQSAVLEWSLRVGVFEGMLHAVLCTMREMSQQHRTSMPGRDHLDSQSQSMSDVMEELEVRSISPARVTQYWDDEKRLEPGKEDDDIDNDKNSHASGGKKASNPRSVKKLKMDAIGKLLLASRSLPSSTRESTRRSEGLSCWDLNIKTSPSASSQSAADVVDAYLKRWGCRDFRGSTGERHQTDRSTRTMRRLEKLDDLADCLLQGITWLEWQARRARIVRGDRPV